jgi:hypothetical protein
MIGKFKSGSSAVTGGFDQPLGLTLKVYWLGAFQMTD